MPRWATSGNWARSYIRPLGAGILADTEHVDEGPTRIVNRLEDRLEASLSVVLDNDTGARGDVRLEVAVDAPGVTNYGVGAGLVEPASQRPVLDEELHVQTG